MLDWLGDHKTLLTWLTGVSLALFVASLVIAPVMILRIQPDYFTHKHRPRGRWDHFPPFVRVMLAIAKNAAGYILILVGVVMLVTPGQGLLTLVLGFLMVDFPGKYRAETWLFSRPRVLKSLNWFRRRRGREPLRPPPGDGGSARPGAPAFQG